MFSFFFKVSGSPRNLHGLTHSFPTRRSSDLLQGPGGMAEYDRRVLGDEAFAKLHSKAAVVDGRYVFVGSFNADARSAKLNTEIALLIDSPELAAQVTRFITDEIGSASCRERVCQYV